MHKFLSLLFFLLLAVGSVRATNKVVRILAIGNSFSEDAVEQYLYELGKEAGYELIIGNVYKGGQTLEGHWKEASTDNNVYEYRKVVKGKKTNHKNQTLKAAITDEPWDYITLQQASHDSGKPDTYEPYLTNLIKYVKSLATNKKMKMGFHMTWAYAQNSTHGGFVYYRNNQMTMYEDILDATKKALEHHRELQFLIPSGTAIQNARGTKLGDTFNRDGYHLDYNIGRYTAACTWLEALFHKKAYHMSYHPIAVTDEQAWIVQHAAHKARRHPFKISKIKSKK